MAKIAECRAIEDARAALAVIKEMAQTWEREYQPRPEDDKKAHHLIDYLKEQEAGAASD